MLRSVSKVISGVLENRTPSNTTQQVVVGSRQWFEWLDDQRSFAFANEVGSFTSRKEKRPGGWYWYAYRRIGGKLRTAYLGKTDELYLERLNKVAGLLAGTHSAKTPKVRFKPEENPDISTNKVVTREAAQPEGKRTPHYNLSQRETEILELLAKEYPNRRIAAELKIAPGTVKKHLENIYNKLKVHSRSQAVSTGYDLRII